ncbi:hypothetical protein [Peribacillus alkalitolerans]|uniref:hypothetical protein n=1 Tax=Peribacillus alkalitolerans TaxID=1550385 RepID=UPI0013D2BFB4|nr:hypothetical protein [Peribacillus alkalitolerans]
MDNNRDNQQGNEVLSNVREEFGTELVGGMNAAKMYELFQITGKSKKEKENKQKR